jgi:membrane protease YdiL (CAAX protease family)
MRHLVDPTTLAPGVFSWMFLAGLLVLLPTAVIVQERQLRALRADGVTLERRQIYASAIVTHLVLLLAALAAARESGATLFPSYAFSASHLFIGLAALAVGSLTFLDAVSSPASRDRSEAIAPQSRSQFAAFAGVALSAGIVEEIVYRGVLFALLAHFVGGWWIPALIAAIAFGLVHLFQGWRAAALAAGAGLLAQVIVGLTGTLLIAIAAHIVHDLVAGAVISRRARRSPGGSPVAV